jgi:magnesium-transporting ATPase (P-type)
MITQLRLELLKLVRSKGFYLSFAALSAFVMLMLWGFYSYAQKKTSGLATEQFKYTYESKSYFNGLTFTLYSLMFAFSLVIPIFVAMTRCAAWAPSWKLRPFTKTFPAMPTFACSPRCLAARSEPELSRPSSWLACCLVLIIRCALTPTE